MGLKEDIVKVVDVLKIASLFLNLEKEFEPYFERILAGETNFTENSETIEEMKLCLKKYTKNISATYTTSFSVFALIQTYPKSLHRIPLWKHISPFTDTTVPAKYTPGFAQ